MLYVLVLPLHERLSEVVRQLGAWHRGKCSSYLILYGTTNFGLRRAIFATGCVADGCGFDSMVGLYALSLIACVRSASFCMLSLSHISYPEQNTLLLKLVTSYRIGLEPTQLASGQWLLWLSV